MNSSLGNNTGENKGKCIKVEVTVRIGEGDSFDYNIVISGDSEDCIEDGDIDDAVIVIENVVRRRIPWARS